MAYFIPRLHPVAAVLVGLFAGPLGLLAAYVIVRVPGRFRIDFRTRGNERSRLLFQVRERRLADDRGQIEGVPQGGAGKFLDASEEKPTGPGVPLLLGLTALLLAVSGIVGYLAWTYVLPRLGLFGFSRPLQPPATILGRPTPPSRNSARSGITLLPGSGTTTPITFEPLRNDPAAAPSSFEMSEIPTSMAWLPDGRLAFATRGEIWLADLNAWQRDASQARSDVERQHRCTFPGCGGSPGRHRPLYFIDRLVHLSLADW